MQNVSTQVCLRSGRLLEELRIYPPDQVPVQVETEGDDFGTASLPAAPRPSPRRIERPSPSLNQHAGPDQPEVDRLAPRMIELPRSGSTNPPIGSIDAPTPRAAVSDPRAPAVASPASRAQIASAPTPTPTPTPNGAITNPAAPSLEIEDGETTLFEAAIGAFHAGEFQRAESLFLEEAQGSVDVAPQRAAIAFRQAALAAKQAGNIDGSDHWMRLAGREYLKVSEDDRTPLPYIREAALMAAKCFLSVENLHVASKGLRRAQAIESVLGADDDLMAAAPGIPFRHGDTAPTPVTRSEDPRGDRRSADSVGGGLRAGRSTADPGAASATHRTGWIRRFRTLHAGRGAA